MKTLHRNLDCHEIRRSRHNKGRLLNGKKKFYTRSSSSNFYAILNILASFYSQNAFTFVCSNFQTHSPIFVKATIFVEHLSMNRLHFKADKFSKNFYA